jgi:hypothetical protein
MPTNTAMRRNIRVTDTNNCAKGSQTSRRYTMREAAQITRCADAAHGKKSVDFPLRHTDE